MSIRTRNWNLLLGDTVVALRSVNGAVITDTCIAVPVQ